MNDVMTLAEVAEYLKLSTKTLLKMVNNNEIPCAKIANQWRFSRSKVTGWLNDQMDSGLQNELSRLISTEPGYVPISRLIQENTIALDLKAKSKEEALRELTDMAENAEVISNPDLFLSKLKEREEMTTTALSHGIALPHLRHPLPDIIIEPRIIIGFSKKGIDFGASDRHLSHVFFLPITDSDIVHLRVIAKLMRIVQNLRLLSRLKSLKTKGEIKDFFIQTEKDL